MEFQPDEHKQIILLGVVAGIVVAFKSVVTLSGASILISTDPGLVYLLLAIIGMIISVYIHEVGHKFIAYRIGYRTNVEGYYPGQVIGVVLAIFTFGFVQFFTPNTADLEALPEKRIHKHRRYENPKQQAFIAASGILFSAVFATVLHGAYLVTSAELLRQLMIGNILIMVYSLIPFELLGLYMLRISQSIEQLPQSDGLYIFQYSPVAYMTAASFSLFLSLLLAFTTAIPVFVAVVLGLVCGLGLWFKFFLEQN